MKNDTFIGISSEQLNGIDYIMIKKWLYLQFANYYIPHKSNEVLSIKRKILKYCAQILEKILGYAVFQYGSIYLTAGPLGFLDHFIIKGKNINPYLTSAIKQYLSQGGLFLDIGANHGVFSLLAANNPNTTVFAFEPSTRELTRLWKNLQLNPKNNISVMSYGLSATEMQQEFRIGNDDNPGMNSLPHIYSKGKLIKCHFSSLSMLLSPHIINQARLCKMDVEGQEMIILQSLSSHMPLLKQCVFIIEVSPNLLEKTGFDVDALYHFFEQAGFTYQYGDNGYAQWEECFYHPSYSSELILSEELI